MNRLILAFALAASFAPSALAADGLGRDLSGRLVAAQPEYLPRAMVFFSMRDASSLDAVAGLQDMGVEVVLVSRDSAGQAAELRCFLARRGISAPVVVDASGAVASRYAVAGPSIVVVSAAGKELVRSPRGDASLAAITSAILPSAMREALAMR